MAASAPARSADARSAVPPGRLSRLLGDPRRVLLVAAVLAAFAACVDVLDDPDLFWHLRLGRWILDNRAVPHHELFSYTAQGNPMTAHEWGSEVVFSLLNSAGGLLAVALLMGLVGWSALVALALRARARGVGPVVTAVALLVGARAAEPVLGTRPQVITVALVCWTLLLAEAHLRRAASFASDPRASSIATGLRAGTPKPPISSFATGRRRLFRSRAAARSPHLVWVLAPIGLLWANLHAGVVLGVAALALAAALEALTRLLRRPGAAPWRRIGELSAATGAMAALVCLNPNGPGLYRYVVQTSSSERLKPITEWHTPDFRDPTNLGLLVLLASFVLLLALGGRPTLRDLGMAVAGLGASLLAVRNTSLAVVLALPAWAVMLQQVAGRGAAWRSARAGSVRRPAAPAARGPALALGGVIVALALSVDGVVVARAAADASASGVGRVYPSCAAAALESADGVRAFAPYFHSGYLVDQLWPRGHVYLYGESVSLGLAVFDDYERILGGGATGLRLLDSSGTNAVVTGPGALRDTLAASPAWHHVLDDRSGLSLYATPALAAQLAGQSCQLLSRP